LHQRVAGRGKGCHMVAGPGKTETTVLDLRGEVCPYAFVKTRLTLEDMEQGSILKVIVDYRPASASVPKNIRTMGDTVVSVTRLPGPAWEIIIKRTG